jgi:thioredoxin-like negative regulator of GroEL
MAGLFETEPDMTENENAIADDTLGRFFKPRDWAAFWTSFFIVLAVYAATMAPTVTLEDSGELAVASDYLGVPHPPGYPIWTLLTWLFTKIFAFVKFRGQPNPAWGVVMFSVFSGALAAGITAMLICRTGRDMLRDTRERLHRLSAETEGLICWAGGVVASLALAFSPVMWSQSVIVEVYSLNALFLVAVFLLTYRWMCRPTDLTLWATAFVFGLGLTNYQVLLLAALPLVLVILLKDTKLFRDFLILGIPYVAVMLLIKMGKLPAIDHPTHRAAIVYMILNVAAMVLAFLFLPRGRTVALTVLMAELGISFYAFMPIVSDLRNPPMNWAYPRTWEGFQHAITRGQYEKISPMDVFSAAFIRQMGAYLEDLRLQFTLLVAPLGLLPFSVWRIRIGNRTIPMLYSAVALGATGVALAMAHKFLAPGSESLAFLYKIIFLGAVVIQAVGVLAIFANQVRELVRKLRKTGSEAISEKATVALVLLGGCALAVGFMVIIFMRVFQVTAPLRDAARQVTGIEQRTIMAQAAALVFVALLPLIVGVLIGWLTRDKRLEFKVDLDSTFQKWGVGTIAGFLVMSVLLIALANPKGDIQDAFIQRVKFISSHALYAFWIGYGLIFALSILDTVLKGHRAVKTAAILSALVLPLIPIRENYFNRELIRVSGGSEQNGHDFGWQFGNYQLRGADAIAEELDPDEEPLPNPCFPEEMSPNAVFYGGTDPGRFVPTYMIYSALVREDVYLITQNALADNTYMNVMRDLYGDQIWIPAQSDSARAFQRYVEEVNSGKRPRNAQLTIENGRVQVSGALGVMEINGILAQMIFEHNNFRHDFYVEESYVIPWMYPYMTPHGLIMKINRNQGPIAADIARWDLDFWDWYVRRLTANSKFDRDVVARKSFSKLRSALGGLYRSHGMFAEAEKAFQEARVLYDLSPEANFRLAQEVLIPLQRFDDAKEVIRQFSKDDPGNDRAVDFLRQIQSIKDLVGRIATMEQEIQGGRLDVNKALELAALYLQAGQTPRFMALCGGILQNTNLPALYMFRVAQLFERAQKQEEMVRALDQCVATLPADAPPGVLVDCAGMYAKVQRNDRMLATMLEYLRRNQTDWRAWLDVATMLMAANRLDEGAKALDEAVRHGGAEAFNIIQKDARFAPLRSRLMPRANLFGFPPAGRSESPMLR